MTVYELPHWCRIALLQMSLVSFLPQLAILLVRRDSSGISPFYVLFHLINATEQFTLCFPFLGVLAWDPQFGDSVVVHAPPTRGDWINLAHMAVVWALRLAVFTLTLSFRPYGLGLRFVPLAVYSVHLLISVVPEFLFPATGIPQDQAWFPIWLFWASTCVTSCSSP